MSLEQTKQKIIKTLGGKMPRRELCFEDLERMMIPKRYWDASFDKIDSDVQSIAQRYLMKLDEMVERGIGLMLWGENGRGKTCLAVVLGKELRRCGKTVLFMECANQNQPCQSPLSSNSHTP
jgi:DNA replication protein DnaC